jgi:hypothetical protein
LLITSLRFLFVKTSVIVCENNKILAENFSSGDVSISSQIEFRQLGWAGRVLAYLALCMVSY